MQAAPPCRGAPDAAAIVPSAAASTPAPIAQRARIADIDVIRGLALFGVLICNLAFCFRVPRLSITRPPNSHLDDIVVRLVKIFLADKSMTLFSMLFGAGLSIFFERACARGSGAVQLVLRRLGILLLVGLAHLFLFWDAEILVNYALAGCVAMLFLRSRPAAVWTAIAVLTAFTVFGPSWPALDAVSDAKSHLSSFYPERDQASLHVYATGSYLEIVRFRAWDVVHFWWMDFVFYWPDIIRNMLVGILAWRSGVLRAPHEHLRALRWTAITGIGLGGGYSIHRAIDSMLHHTPRTAFVHEVLPPVFALGYAAAMISALQTRLGKKCLGIFAPVGRMAFTHYLMQTFVFTTVFYGYGFGLSSQVGYTSAALMGAAFYTLQVAISPLWLRSFRFGPFEWIRRSLTYGTGQPMRVRRDAHPAP